MNGQTVIAEIQSLIQLYLDGIHEGSVELLQQVMHSDCRMVCPSQNEYSNIGMTEYYELVANRQSPSDVGEPRVDEILSISQINSEVAVVRLRCLVLGKHCEDALTLCCHEGGWRIISKVFSYELL